MDHHRKFTSFMVAASVSSFKYFNLIYAMSGWVMFRILRRLMQCLRACCCSDDINLVNIDIEGREGGHCDASPGGGDTAALRISSRGRRPHARPCAPQSVSRLLHLAGKVMLHLFINFIKL